MNRVVVTGLGCLTAAGENLNQTWKTLIAGKNLAKPIRRIQHPAFKNQVACEVGQFQSNQYPVLNHIPDLCLGTQYALIALQEAIRDSGYQPLESNAIPISLGVNFQECNVLQTMVEIELKNGPDAIPSELFPMNRTRFITEQLAQKFNLKGKQMPISAACASGNYAQAYAYDAVKFGVSPIAIAGAESVLSLFGLASFSKLGILSSDYCRPFDKNRKGLLIGEGAAFMVLEEYEHAKKRGAQIYAEFLGYGITCDAYHPVIPEPQGIYAAQSIEKALKMAKLDPGQIDYISAHGTGTPGNDPAEVSALQSVFKSHLKHLPVSSIKSMIGHSFSASAAMESVMCCKVFVENGVPPTINFETPDPQCDIDCVPNTARELKPKYIVNNAFGFGGYNAIVVLGRV